MTQNIEQYPRFNQSSDGNYGQEGEEAVCVLTWKYIRNNKSTIKTPRFNLYSKLSEK